MIAVDQVGLSKPKIFFIIWTGQVISILGSGLTTFAVGIWVYERTKSLTSFGLTILSSTLPSLIITPLAGVLVDYWDRRKLMILSDLGSSLCSLVIILLLLT